MLFTHLDQDGIGEVDIAEFLLFVAEPTLPSGNIQSSFHEVLVHPAPVPPLDSSTQVPSHSYYSAVQGPRRGPELKSSSVVVPRRSLTELPSSFRTDVPWRREERRSLQVNGVQPCKPPPPALSARDSCHLRPWPRVQHVENGASEVQPSKPPPSASSPRYSGRQRLWPGTQHVGISNSQELDEIESEAQTLIQLLRSSQPSQALVIEQPLQVQMGMRIFMWFVLPVVLNLR